MYNNIAGKALLIIILILTVMLSSGCIELFLWLSGLSEKPADECPNWDSDCDNISYAVETNDVNSYLGLDPDIANENPTIAHGIPTEGWTENALNLRDSETGYYHFNGEDATDTDDWGTLHIINMIEGAGRKWYANNALPPRIQVADLSWGNVFTGMFGGKFGDHASHQNGLDVDLRYLRIDDHELSLNIATNPDKYDVTATIALINTLLMYCDIDLIYVDTVHAGIRVSDPIKHWPGHQDHFHVRILDPDGTMNKQIPINTAGGK